MIDWNQPHKTARGVMPAVIGWLRKDRWFTDRAGAESSPFVYGVIEDNYAGTSILGVINGILPRFGIVLVCTYETGTGKPVPPYLAIYRRWWEL